MSLSTHLGSLLSSIRLTGSHIPKTKDCADPTEPDLLEMSHVQGSPDSVSASEADKPANGANRLCDFGQKLRETDGRLPTLIRRMAQRRRGRLGKQGSVRTG